ncbi:MAG: Bax inhibitor-1/YccA family protein [Candidatus Doudnabacteria bacterium]
MEFYQDQPTIVNAAVSTAEQQTFVREVFGWMSLALFISAALAYLVSTSKAIQQIIFGTPLLFMGLIIAEFGLVIYLTARISKMSLSAARTSFFLYAALNGLTLSTVFLVYTAGSLATTFAVAGSTFGVMALYGYVTKKDLTSWGHLLLMFLFGIIIAGFINIFLKSTTLYWTTTIIGIGLFVGLTAYDTQKIKYMANGGTGGSLEKGAILGALMLYLDFINLFLFLLRIFGRRRN